MYNSSPTRPPTRVPLIRTNCRSLPICSSIFFDVSSASHCPTVYEMSCAASPRNWSYCGGARLSQPKGGEGRLNSAIDAWKSHRVHAGAEGTIVALGSR